MQWLRNHEIAIVAGEQLPMVRKSGKTALELSGEILNQILLETGIERSQIDGIAMTLSNSEGTNAFWTSVVCESLGISARWSQVSDIGGCSVVGNIARASSAIHCGFADIVLCLAADSPSTHFRMKQTGYREEFCEPFGYGLPVSFGLLTSAYAAKYRNPELGMAKLAITQRNGALLNEATCIDLRKPLTEQDYLSSRMISDPLRLLDCVMRCDGANAFLLMSTKKAKELGFSKMAHPIAYRERMNFDPLGSIDDITLTGFSEVGPKVLKDAGLTANQINSFHPYDDFYIALILQLEQIGFCSYGEAEDFILSTDIGINGKLPINSGGGQISLGQPGLAGGGVNLLEAVTQLLGKAGTRQSDIVKNALVTGIGVIQYARNWGCSAALLLEASS